MISLINSLQFTESIRSQYFFSRLKFVLIAFFVFGLCDASMAFYKPTKNTNNGELPTIQKSALPKEALPMLKLIEQGGPFTQARDAIPFGNREGVLPKKQRGFYKEYTVRTPGVNHRGARRIVCGGAEKSIDLCYYSDDHYQSFSKIAD
jgi:ribonuclease T1